MAAILQIEEPEPKPKPCQTIDEVRRAMYAAGMSSESAAIACGFMAEYAMTAYKAGYVSGFADGVDWGKRRV
jgi:hypothetical protein